MTAAIISRGKWPLLAALASAGMLAAAHGFEYFGRMFPCPLCLVQRQVYWAALALGVVGVLSAAGRARPRMLSTIDILLGVAFLAGTGIASYHAGVEWGWFEPPSTCAASTKLDLSQGSLWDQLGGHIAVASCAEAPGRVLGLSMAGWNALVSLGLAGLSLASAFSPGRTDASEAGSDT